MQPTAVSVTFLAPHHLLLRAEGERLLWVASYDGAWLDVYDPRQQVFVVDDHWIPTPEFFFLRPSILSEGYCFSIESHDGYDELTSSSGSTQSVRFIVNDVSADVVEIAQWYQGEPYVTSIDAFEANPKVTTDDIRFIPPSDAAIVPR